MKECMKSWILEIKTSTKFVILQKLSFKQFKLALDKSETIRFDPWKIIKIFRRHRKSISF